MVEENYQNIDLRSLVTFNFGNKSYPNQPAQGALTTVGSMIPIQPFWDFSPVIAVPTSTALVDALTISSPIYLTDIDFVVSADAIANGVAVYISISAGSGGGTYYIPNRAANTKIPVTIGNILNIGTNTPYAVLLPAGSVITVYATATLPGSTMQVAYIGELVTNIP